MVCNKKHLNWIARAERERGREKRNNCTKRRKKCTNKWFHHRAYILFWNGKEIDPKIFYRKWFVCDYWHLIRLAILVAYSHWSIDIRRMANRGWWTLDAPHVPHLHNAHTLWFNCTDTGNGNGTSTEDVRKTILNSLFLLLDLVYFFPVCCWFVLLLLFFFI